jgi:glycosyltransferase involved in cell wall biosynthesis
MQFHVVTRCSRVSNLLTLLDTVYSSGVNVSWHIVFDTKHVKNIEVSLLSKLNEKEAQLYFRDGDGWGLSNLNDILKSLPQGYVFHLDDDNIMHPDYYRQLTMAIDMHPDKKVFCYGQLVDEDFNQVRYAYPESTVVGGIDLAQYTVHTDVYKTMSYGSGYTADGEFIESYFKSSPEEFVFINEVLCYYNYIPTISVKKTSAPKVLYIGEDKPELKSYPHLGYEDTSLNVDYATEGDLIWEDYNLNKYDAIISTGGNWEDVPILPQKFSIIRKRWLHTDKVNGELAYNVAMNAILNPHKPKISFFTPAYKTPIKRIENLYNSLENQFMDDWEWVIVNDSPDDQRLSEWLKIIAQEDERVKVFTFNEPSGGCIGDVKYKAAMLCSGDILAELDHDDELLRFCGQYLVEASEAHPECGFFYTNCVEVDENYNCLKYPDGFALGYGKYRKTFDKSVMWEYEESICVGVNPKTIRHIVGVPNHIRAWRRDVYHKIGGHNRRLTIADDYELIVRTFLNTKFCHIDACGYIQFIYNNESGQNTHDATRGDIQRRVRTIAQHYNHDIANRFYHLGVKDWAYEFNPNNPLLASSRYGEEENAVNVIYKPKSLTDF